MKSHLTLALLAFMSALLFASCSEKENDPDDPGNPSLPEENMNIFAYADEFFVESEPIELENWTIDYIVNSSQNPWVRVVTASGGAGERAKFTFHANLTEQHRYAEAKLSGYDAKKKKVERTIEIQQSPLDENSHTPSLRLSSIMFTGHTNFFYVRDTDLTKNRVRMLLNGGDLDINIIDAHNASFEVPEEMKGPYRLIVFLGDKTIDYGFVNVYRWDLPNNAVEELPAIADFADNKIMVSMKQTKVDNWYNILFDSDNNETLLYLRNKDGRILGGGLMSPTFLCDGYISCGIMVLNKPTPYKFDDVNMTVTIDPNGCDYHKLIANTRTGQLIEVGTSKKVYFSSKDENGVNFLIYDNGYEMMTIRDDGHVSTREIKGVNDPVGNGYPIVSGNTIQTSENWIFNGIEMVIPRPLDYRTSSHVFHEGDGSISNQFIILPFRNDIARFSRYTGYNEYDPSEAFHEIDLRSAVDGRQYFYAHWTSGSTFAHHYKADYDAFVYDDHAVFRPLMPEEDVDPPQPMVTITKDNKEKLMPTEEEWKLCKGRREIINHSITSIYNGGDFGYYKTGERFRISSFDAPVKLKNFPEKYYSAIATPRGLTLAVFTGGGNLSIYHYNTDTDTPEITVVKAYNEIPGTVFNGWLTAL